MWLYKFLESPRIYNLSVKLTSLNHRGLRRYILKLIKVEPNDCLLDVGCGTGKYAIFPCKYFGIDINENYINYAKRNHPGIFLEMDGADLKFPDAKFDFVINISTLHHVADDLVEKMIIEMKRVCKKGGSIFIIDAVYPKKINFLGYILFKLDRGRYRRRFEDLKKLLSKFHFKLVSSGIRKTFPYRWVAFSCEC